ncbi:hypothetical protein Hanom_Chr01g00093391 [Helianthus anomalus]
MNDVCSYGNVKPLDDTMHSHMIRWAPAENGLVRRSRMSPSPQNVIRVIYHCSSQQCVFARNQKIKRKWMFDFLERRNFHLYTI